MRDDLTFALRRSFDGNAWHGPSLREVLDGVDAAAALQRPVADAHSIWELTHHLMAWTREVTRRLRGATAGMPTEGNWVDATDTSEDAWRRLRASLDDARDELMTALAGLPADRLDDRVRELQLDGSPGGEVTLRLMLIGLAEHNAYHGGQIVLVRRAVTGRRPTPAEGAAPEPGRDAAQITES
jgi:uncharacterized damage-inducible protein DinB